MAGSTLYTFEVVPQGMAAGYIVSTDGFTFEPFVMEVPSMSGADFAARRCWWQAFHLLGARGFEPEDFQVFAFENEQRGREVRAAGFVEVTA